MAELTDGDWNELARDLTARIGAFSPEWTDRSASDPGVTILELFGFLAESILDRADGSAEGRARLLEILNRLGRSHVTPCPDGTLTRNRWFAGRLLSAEDLEREQDYQRTKDRRHNRLLHGYGIVQGLEVTVESGASGGATITVSPGVAIDQNGEELLLCEPTTRDVCDGKTGCSVTVRLLEQSQATEPGGESTRVEESADIAVIEDVPAGHLTIARLVRDGDAWRLDPSFAPARVAH